MAQDHLSIYMMMLEYLCRANRYLTGMKGMADILAPSLPVKLLYTNGGSLVFNIVDQFVMECWAIHTMAAVSSAGHNQVCTSQRIVASETLLVVVAATTNRSLVSTTAAEVHRLTTRAR